jgi:hypothetical protein
MLDLGVYSPVVMLFLRADKTEEAGAQVEKCVAESA